MTNGVSNIVSRFVTTARSAPSWLDVFSPLYSHRFERDFRVSRNFVSVNPRSLEEMRTDLAQLCALADVANRYDKRIAHATSEAIRDTIPNLKDEVTPDVAQRFLSLMDHPARLGELLRNLYEMAPRDHHPGLYARPLVAAVQRISQVHGRRALPAPVEAATAFSQDNGPLGAFIGASERSGSCTWRYCCTTWVRVSPRIIATSADIAEKTAHRLGLSEADTETLKFLVHKHLQMAHLAFRRDTSDPQLMVTRRRGRIARGAADVVRADGGGLRRCRAGRLNGWKVQVLTDVYRAAMVHLAGDAPALRNEDVLRTAPGRCAGPDYGKR